MNSEFRSLKCALFTGCAIFALAGTAHAADAPAASGTNAPIPGEIIVTAQRRNESLQNVPMTLQALSGDALEKLNVTTFNDLLRYTPNVTFGNNGPGSGSIFMRGLSTGFAGNQSAAANGLFPNVAVYLDDQSMQFPFHNVYHQQAKAQQAGSQDRGQRRRHRRGRAQRCVFGHGQHSRSSGQAGDPRRSL
jgi:hypothetical protein